MMYEDKSITYNIVELIVLRSIIISHELARPVYSKTYKVRKSIVSTGVSIYI